MIFNWKFGYVPWLPSLQWRHNEHDGVSNHQPHDCLLNRLFRWKLKKTSKLRVTGLCEGNSPVIGEFPAQMASNAGSVCIWWRHHDCVRYYPGALSHGTIFVACLRIRVFCDLPVSYRQIGCDELNCGKGTSYFDIFRSMESLVGS